MRITVLMAVSMVALAAPATAQEIRQVAPGITMAPGTPKSAKAKQAETPKVETSKSQKTTYGDPVAPALAEPAVEAKVETPKPAQPAVAVNAKREPDRNAVSRPVAASPAAIPSKPASQQKVVTAPERPRVQPQAHPPQAREPRVGDRIPAEARLYPSQRVRVRVGDRVPDHVQLYDLPRSALR